LSADHNDSSSYKPIEELLDEQRPKPLMMPLEKSASIQKKATLFGWMNNLEISDGSTIPGLSDRVMSWEDGSEDFAWTEKEIRSQPRYNPSYDVKGFYYRWMEPRFKPQLWDDMTNDYLSNVSPAKRFAEKGEVDSDFIYILSILAKARASIDSGDVEATRFVMSEDIIPIVNNVIVKNSPCGAKFYNIGEEDNGDEIYAVWIHSKDADTDQIEEIENGIKQKRFDRDFRDKVKCFLKSDEKKEKTIEQIVATAKEICEEYEISDVYLVGGYPRDMALGRPLAEVEDLDFSGAWPGQSIKVGGLLAERLGATNVELYHRTMTLSFTYKGVKVDFRGNFSPVEIRSRMREYAIKTSPLNMDVYNRDFTINMMVYDLRKEKLLDVCGESVKDLQSKTIRTFFDSDFICSQNPLIIMRALKFHIRYGFDISKELQKAMIQNAPLLFNGDFSNERLIIARENVRMEGDEADDLFSEYGLDRIKEI